MKFKAAIIGTLLLGAMVATVGPSSAGVCPPGSGCESVIEWYGTVDEMGDDINGNLKFLDNRKTIWSENRVPPLPRQITGLTGALGAETDLGPIAITDPQWESAMTMQFMQGPQPGESFIGADQGLLQMPVDVTNTLTLLSGGQLVVKDGANIIVEDGGDILHSGGDAIFNATQTFIVIVNNQTLIFAEDSTGFVGINNDDPQDVLDVNGNIVPHTDGTYALGSSSLRWTDLYLDSVIHHNGDLVFESNGDTTAILSDTGDFTVPGTLSAASITGTVVADWADIVGIPPVLADGLVAWSELTGVPAGFADGVDHDTTYDGGDFALSGQECSFGTFAAGIDGVGDIICATPSSDAGTLDSLDSSQFLRADANNSYTGNTLAWAGGALHPTGVSATTFSGDGSSLTGVAMASQSCGIGDVVTGIDASGGLICSAAPPAAIVGGPGEQVGPFAPDYGRALTSMPGGGHAICYHDADNDGFYDQNGAEGPWLHVGTNSCVGESVSVHDWRLVTTTGGSGMTKVSIVDADFGLPLTAWMTATTAEIDVFDVDGDGFYSRGDWVYADRDDSGTVTSGDYRWTDAGSNAAGTLVLAGSTDFGFGLMTGAADGGLVDLDVALKFWNVDTVAQTYEAPLYLDMNRNAAVDGADVRLTDLALV